MENHIIILALMCALNCVSGYVTRILVLLPERRGKFFYPFGMEKSGAAVKIAIDDIHESGILNNTTLEVEYVNTKCDGVHALGKTSEKLQEKRYSAIIGPQCSGVCRHVGRLAAYHNTACFTGVCQDTEMLQKTIFKTLTRFLGTFDKVGLAVVGMMKKFGWSRIGIIAQEHTDKIWLYTRDAVKEMANQNGFTVAVTRTYIDSEPNNLRDILSSVAANSRNIRELMSCEPRIGEVVVVAVRGETFRSLMLHAYVMGLTTGSYVFICVYYYPQTFTFGDYSWKMMDEYDSVAREAYKSVLFLSYFTPTTVEYLEFTEKVKHLSRQLFNYTYGEEEEVPYPAAILYEAMHVFALSINSSLGDGSDCDNGELISSRLWGKSFISLTGNVSLNNNGDRQQGYKIEQITEHFNFTLQAVGYFFTDIGYFVEDTDNPIKWPNNKGPPLDRPVCGSNGENCDIGVSQTQILRIVVGTLVGLIILILAFSVLIQKIVVRNIRKKANEMTWRIRPSDLVMTTTSLFSVSRLSIRSEVMLTDSRCNAKKGYYKGSAVLMKTFENIKPGKFNFKEFQQLRDLDHSNVNRVHGFCLEQPDICMVTDYCPKGSLTDILENEDINLDWDFRCCLLWDLLQGIEYIFRSNIRYHGNLKSDNCLIDGRFVLKLTDFGPKQWSSFKKKSDRDKLYISPEHLRSEMMTSVSGFQSADIYSLAIVMHELFQRNGPFGIECMEMQPFEVLQKIRSRSTFPSFRPTFEPNSCPPNLMYLICKCWDDDNTSRPTIKYIKKEMDKITNSKMKAENFFDNLLKRMEQYAQNLEGIVEERTSKYLQEKRKAEDLLFQLLPQSIAYQIQSRGFVDPEWYDSVTIMFTDVVKFTALSAESSPLEIIEMLNDLYSNFDVIINEYDVYKVETIGDAYMCASGLPQRNTYHQYEVAQLAISVMRMAERFHIRHKPERRLELRAGINSGPCVAGVIGVKMPRYCLFGDTVNTASRMESSSEASRIQISGSTAALLRQYPNISISTRGETYIKGKGTMLTHWLDWKEH